VPYALLVPVCLLVTGTSKPGTPKGHELNHGMEVDEGLDFVGRLSLNSINEKPRIVC
jgi:hypothetical protein